ncbi:hypothetical protein CIB48_g5752 [Xylaria polymorpha]|nr:hypothetical protein CIB48_g5752 [Xylaria polymorpha]
MTPIGIRYYSCRNAGRSIIIWLQLRNASNNDKIVWDDQEQYMYEISNDTSVKVDLKDTGIPSGQEFILAENTLFGDDMWDSSQTFFYDPHSNRTAYATKWGGKEDGRLTYDGCTPAIEVESSACAEKK